MKVVVKTDELQRLVSVANVSVDKKGIVEVLEQIRFIAQDKKLKSISTNMEIGHVLTIDAKVEEPGDVLISAMLLFRAVSKLPGEATTLEIKDGKLEVSSEKTKFKIPINTSEENAFPDIESFFGSSSMYVDASLIVKMLSRASVSCLINASDRPYLGGVCLEFDGETLSATSSDANSLAHVSAEVEGEAFDPIIVPLDSVREAIRLIKMYNPKNVDIGHANDMFFMYFDGVSFMSRLIEGSFPKYKPLLEVETSDTIEFSPSYLNDVLERASLFRTKDMPILSIVHNEGSLYAYTNQRDSGTFNEELQLLEESDVPTYSLYFNPAFLMRSTKIVPSEATKVLLNTSPKTSAPIIVALDKTGDEHIKEDIYLLMQMKVA